MNARADATMGQSIADELDDGEVVEAVCHCERVGPLQGGTDEWHRYDSLAGLPDRPLDGWEQLVVFTSEHVYRRVGVGYGGGTTVVPRTPEALATAADVTAAPTAEDAAADDD